MNANINIDAIKQYNTSLKQYRDQSAKLNAEINFLSNEIDTLCKELTAELGMEVTRDNVEQVCSDLCEKINSNLQSGNAVLSKIAGETNKMASEPQASVGTTAPSAQPAPSMPANIPQTLEAPADTIPVAPVHQTGTFMSGQPTAGSVFGQPTAAPNIPANSQSLPGFFSGN